MGSAEQFVCLHTNRINLLDKQNTRENFIPCFFFSRMLRLQQEKVENVGETFLCLHFPTEKVETYEC